MTATIRLVDPRTVEHALSETSSAAPHWGPHDLDHTESAALAGDAYDDRHAWELREEYRMGWWWGLVCGALSGAFVGGIVIGVARGLLA